MIWEMKLILGLRTTHGEIQSIAEDAAIYRTCRERKSSASSNVATSLVCAARPIAQVAAEALIWLHDGSSRGERSLKFTVKCRPTPARNEHLGSHFLTHGYRIQSYIKMYIRSFVYRIKLTTGACREMLFLAHLPRAFVYESVYGNRVLQKWLTHGYLW
jgi:hypothetical protein